MFCASQEVREAILGVAFSPPKGWRQRHGARFLVPGYGQKNALYYIILYHIILLYIILLYTIYYILYIILYIYAICRNHALALDLSIFLGGHTRAICTRR